jgi:hypothetical protein
MAEITDNKKKSRRTEDMVQVEKASIEAEELQGFTQEEIARLIKAKQEVTRGRYTDMTLEHKKLLFVQWLIEHGRLKS